MMLTKIINNIKYLAQLISYMSPSLVGPPPTKRHESTGQHNKALALTLFGDKKYLSEYYLLNEAISDSNISITFQNIDCEFQYPRRYHFITLARSFNQEWINLYKRIGAVSEVTFNSEVNTSSPEFIKAEEIIAGLVSKEDLLDFYYKDIKIGDLVYDTYLRFRPNKTLDIHDPYLLEVMYHCLLICNNALKELPKYSLLISPYVGYIQWGIYPRVAQHLNIKCIIIGYANQFAKTLRSDFPIQCKDHDLYNAEFKLTEKEINQAKTHLDSRLRKGVLDSAISYMTVNPFQSTRNFNLKEQVSLRPSAIFFLHSFSDCPHIFRDMLFPDFYEWIVQSLDVASETDFQFFIKPHPADPLADEIIVELKKRYPQFIFLDKTVGNLEIAESGMKAIFTIYGTVAHEFPYLGVPAICAGDNPHINFSFCKTANSKEEYFYHIKNIDKLSPIKKEDEIASFYYQHNILPFPGRLNENEYSSLLDYQKHFKPKGSWPIPGDIIASIRKIIPGIINE